MRTAIGKTVLVVALAVMVQAGSAAAWATGWTAGLHSGSSGEAAAQAPPAVPSPSAACSGLVLGSIIVTWGAITHASYTVYKSTTSATTGFTVAATVAAGTTTYTQSGLGLGSYWFEVSASIGTNWVSANSAATAKRTITLVLCS